MEKQKLNPQIAEQFAKNIFEKLPLEKDREFNKIHAKSLIGAALILAGDQKIDLELIIIASWLHDLGKIVEMHNHAQHSIAIIKNEGFEISKELEDCILNHGNKGNPICQEAKLIQIADKACIIHPEILEMLVNFSLKKSKEEKTKDLEFIKKLMSDAVELLTKY